MTLCRILHSSSEDSSSVTAKSHSWRKKTSVHLLHVSMHLEGSAFVSSGTTQICCTILIVIIFILVTYILLELLSWISLQFWSSRFFLLRSHNCHDSSPYVAWFLPAIKCHVISCLYIGMYFKCNITFRRNIYFTWKFVKKKRMFLKSLKRESSKLHRISLKT